MTVPLNPPGAALHAIVVQGGFSTPAIEAIRIVKDALSIVEYGELDERWTQGIKDTLQWLDDNAGPEVEDAKDRTSSLPGDWYETLSTAIGAR